jgi:hypothetical protein
VPVNVGIFGKQISFFSNRRSRPANAVEIPSSHLEPSFVSLIFFCFSKEIMMSAPHGRMADAIALRKMERWFAELTGKQLQRAVHRPTAQPDADIHAFIAPHNNSPKPCRWTRSANQISRRQTILPQDTPHPRQRTSHSG